MDYSGTAFGSTNNEVTHNAAFGYNDRSELETADRYTGETTTHMTIEKKRGQATFS